MNEPTLIVCPHCRSANRVPTARLGDAPTCGRCREALFTGQPLALDEAGFERVFAREGIALLVDFWAPWCGPCLQMAPSFAEAAAALEPVVRLAKVDTEAERALASRFAIRSIPTLILFRDNRELTRQSGAMQTDGIVGWTRRMLGR